MIVNAARFVTFTRFAELTGYSVKAIEHKVHGGVWLEGEQYHRAPDGRLLADMEAYTAWVEGEPAPSKLSRRASASASTGAASVTTGRSTAHRRHQISAQYDG